MSLPRGFTASGIAAGLKPSGKPDLGLLATELPATVAGVFTTNRVVAAPVQLTKRLVRRGSARAVVVNAGNANACTGKQGLTNAKEMGSLAGRALGVPAKDVLVASTGIIGVPMDMAAVRSGIPLAAGAASPDGLDHLARSIMTTDTVPKTASASALGGSIVGVAKGSGMIAPEMATMLAFVVTDLPLSRGVLHDAIVAGSRASFNLITVDGCMSTNDCVLALANGAAGGETIEVDDPRAAEAAEALAEVCSSLARQIVADGEGATKVVAITVEGASKEKEARLAASTIANSVLLRCAVHGADPNWGRVLAALGTAPIPFDQNTIDVWIGSEQMCARGMRGPGDESKAAAAMADAEVQIRVGMNRGSASATVLTNDLSPEYIRINAEYRT